MRSAVRHTLRLLSMPTPWPRPRAATVWFLVITIVGVITLILPRTSGWRGDYLHSEDGQVFLSEYLANGVGSIVQTYAGYLHVVPRLVTAFCADVIGPDRYAPCVAVSANVVRAAPLVVAFPVLAAYARSWRWGLAAAAAAFLFLPAGQQEVLSNVTNLRWFLLAGTFFAVFGIFRQRWLVLYAATLALLAAVSDPMPLLLLPFAVWRIVQLRGWSRLPGLALIAGTGIHVLSLDASARGERGGFLDLLNAPTQTIGQVLVRGPLVTQWGMHLTQEFTRTIGFPLSIATLVLTAALIVFAWRGRRIDDPAVPFAILLGFLSVVFLLITLSFPGSYIGLWDLWSPSQPARYSALTGLFLMPVLVLCMSRAWHSARDPFLGRLWTIVMIGVLCLAYIGDAGGDDRSTNGPTWAQTLVSARQQCQETGVDPVVPNSAVFEGWLTRLTCDWVSVG